MKAFHIFYCLFILQLPVINTYAQTDSLVSDEPPLYEKIFGFYENKSSGFVPVPLLYYTPDTRWAAGAFGVYYFKLKGADGKNTRLSYAKALADYTQNKQLDLWSSWNIFLKDEAYIFKGDLRYRNFPDRYYGLGNNSQEENVELYSFDLLDITSMLLRQVMPYTFVGIDVRYTKYFNLSYQNNSGELASGLVSGSNGGNNIGFGMVALYDSRDNVINASQGYFAEISTYIYEDIWGSNFNYVNLKSSFSTYFSIKPNHILAYQILGNFNFGNPPFTNMARVGDDMLLRGYANNRYRDNHFLGTQLEFRFPIWWRFGGVTFAGVGDVFGPISELKSNLLKYSYGAGLRFALNSSEKLNVRFDYAFGKDNSTFYIMVTESF